MNKNISFSVKHPEPLTGCSVKLSAETKARFQALIKKGFSANDIIRVACEVHEAELFRIENQVKSGSMKRQLRQMQVIRG
jgi:hypothetical protein